MRAALLMPSDAARASVTLSMAADNSGMFQAKAAGNPVLRLTSAAEPRMGGNQQDVIEGKAS